MREDGGAVDPDLDRPGRPEAQRAGRSRSLRTNARRRRPPDRRDAAARRGRGRRRARRRRPRRQPTSCALPGYVLPSSGAAGSFSGGNAVFKLARPSPNGPMTKRVRQQAERRAQRAASARLAALVEQVRQEPRRLRRDQRMRALRQPAAHRGLERRGVDVLVQRRERGERARRLRAAPRAPPAARLPSRAALRTAPRRGRRPAARDHRAADARRPRDGPDADARERSPSPTRFNMGAAIIAEIQRLRRCRQRLLK